MGLLYFNFLDIFYCIFLVFFSYFDFASKNKTKNFKHIKIHGIEKSNNSRFGGSIILLFLILSQFLYSDKSFLSIENTIFFSTLIFVSLVGFADDAFGGIHYLIKLLFLSFASLILCLTYDVFIFNETGYIIFDLFLNYKMLSLVFSILVIVGFTNALNISDGANGIASGISFVIILIFYMQTNQIIFFIFFKFTLIFFIYNIIRGKIFLGDTGSYMLGFFIASTSIYLYNLDKLSIGILATLLSYPCLEIIFTIIRRFIYNSNPLKPDDNHLHNLIFHKLDKINFRFISSNSMTGILIISIFSLPGFFAYMIIENINNMIYVSLFIIQILIYILIYFNFRRV
jgi:UDP-GlcNAc:undecaprenyl-phosphate/decaprenyl-phosphate GlcNAc-1-phosphate transferase